MYVQRRTCVHFTSSKYACFYWDTHVSAIVKEAWVAGSRQFIWARFFSLLCALLCDLISEADALSFLSRCWELGTSVSRRVSGLKYLPIASGAVRTNALGLCGTVILWCWEPLKYLKYCQRFPRDCSECKALNACESILAGSGPECINFGRSHLTNGLNSA